MTSAKVRTIYSVIRFCLMLVCISATASAERRTTQESSHDQSLSVSDIICSLDVCQSCGNFCEECECYGTYPMPMHPPMPMNQPPYGPPPQPYGQPPQQPYGPPQQGGQQQQGAPFDVPRLPPPQQSTFKKPNCGPLQEGYTVNYENISIIQLIQFISKISGTNFIFDSDDLMDMSKNPPQPYKITLVCDDPTQVSDLSAALLQILKMYNLSVVEQGNNVLIYKNQNMSKVSTVITDKNVDNSCDTAVITRVFKLTNVQADKIATIVRSLVSPEANVEPSIETNHLIVTDITANVNKITDLLEELDKPSFTIDVAEYMVQHADPHTLAEYAMEILTPLSEGTPLTITPEPVSQKIFIVATPLIINRAMQILASLDVAEITSLNPPPPAFAIENNNFFMYKLKYQNGREIADALHEIGSNLQYTGVANPDFVNAVYSAQWLEVNNSIVITGTEEAIHKLIELLDELDQLPKQVYIEVLVLDTTLSNSLDFGVQWIALGEEQNKLAFGTGLLAQAPPAPILEGSSTGVTSATGNGARFVANAPAAGSSLPASSPLVPNPGRDIALPNPTNLNGLVSTNFTEAFGLGIIGNILTHNGQSFLTLGALLSALDEQEDMTIVLNPKIMVEDTQPANFFVGQNIPYQTTSTVIQQTGSVTQNIQYEDVGVQLQVIPTIAPNNMVTLQINQTVADLAIGQSIGTLTPTTNKELVTTRVHVPDGTFLVMSGHIRDQCTYIHSGVPCLGTLPLIGPVFSRTIEQRLKRNLIIFIRPKVVTSIDDGIQLTNDEGYLHNWGSNPCSIIECGCEKAPECEVYPNPCWPPNHPFYPPPCAPNGPMPQQGYPAMPPPPGDGCGMPPAEYGMPPADYNMQPQPYGMPPSEYGMPPADMQQPYGMPVPEYPVQSSEYGMPPSGFPMQPSGYGMPPADMQQQPYGLPPSNATPSTYSSPPSNLPPAGYGMPPQMTHPGY